MAILSTVVVSAGAMVIRGVITTDSFQRRDTATALADDALDLVRAAWQPTAADGSFPVAEGRVQNLVQAQWAAGPPELAGTTPLWDPAPASSPVVPLTVTRTVGGDPYTVDTYLGTCRISPAGTCDDTTATGAVYVRAVVRISWALGQGRTCSGGDCRFVATTLLNGDGDPIFDRLGPRPTAVDDTVTVYSGAPVTLDVLANDTGTLDADPIQILATPTSGTATALPGGIEYDVPAGVSGSDLLTYRLRGSDGSTSATATVRITIVASAVTPDSATASFPTPVVIDVRANDTGAFVDGTVTIADAPGLGTATVSADQIVYTPAANLPGGQWGDPTGPNLVVNGSFEDAPGVDPDSWAYIDTLPGWSRSGAAQFEVQGRILTPARDGIMKAELDSWANVQMYQDVATVPGRTYRLSFWAGPREQVSEQSNVMSVYWNGVRRINLAYAGNGVNPWWDHFTFDLVATQSVTRVLFAGEGIGDTYGYFIDDVQMYALTDPPPPLPAEAWDTTFTYRNSSRGLTGTTSVTVRTQPPPAITTAPITVCMVRGPNASLTFPLAAGVVTGATNAAAFQRTSDPDLSVFSTPQGPLAGDDDGSVTVQAKGTPPTGDYPFSWWVRDAWGRSSANQVTLQVRASC